MAFRGMTVDENNTLGKRVEEAGSYNVRVLPTSLKPKDPAAGISSVGGRCTPLL